MHVPEWQTEPFAEVQRCRRLQCALVLLCCYFVAVGLGCQCTLARQAVAVVAVEEDMTVEAEANIDRSVEFACLLEKRNLT